MSETELLIKDIIRTSSRTDKKQIKDELLLKTDLDMDSMDMAEMLMCLENAFQIDVPDQMIEEFRTVGDLVRYIKDRKEAN